MDYNTVRCKWCAMPTLMTGTKMCDRCWELSVRVRNNLLLAERMVNYYKKHRDAL